MCATVPIRYACYELCPRQSNDEAANWSAANGGLRDGGLSKSLRRAKGLFPPFSGFSRCSSQPPEMGEKAENGRKRPISADFREGWPDAP